MLLILDSGQSTPATLTSFAPVSGPVGTELRIFGTGLIGVTAGAVNGTALTGLTVVSDTEVRGTVASGTTSGRVTLTTPAGPLTSTADFVVGVGSGGSYTDEQAQDAGASMITSGVHSGIVATYGTTQDNANRLDFSVQLPSPGLFYWTGTALQPVTIGAGLTLSSSFVLSASSAQVQSFTFASFGDQNDIFYNLGTNYGTQAWANPAGTARLFATQTTVLNSFQDTNQLTDRGGGYAHTNLGTSNWFGWGLESNRQIRLLTYAVQCRSDTFQYNTISWIVEGSNNVAANTVAGFDAATWTVLDSVTNAAWTGQSSWLHFTCSSPPSAGNGHRWLRIRQTDLNSGNPSGNNRDTAAILGEFAPYGQLLTV